MSLSELQKKEIIDINSGKRIGIIIIKAVILPVFPVCSTG